MQWFAAIWQWCTQSTVHSIVALWIAGTVVNFFIEFALSKRWDAWAERWPRLSGVLLVLKGVFGVTGSIARGLLQTLTGELRKRVDPGSRIEVVFGTTNEDPDRIVKRMFDAVGRSLKRPIEQPVATPAVAEPPAPIDLVTPKVPPPT